jgi:hypothetical protein
MVPGSSDLSPLWADPRLEFSQLGRGDPAGMLEGALRGSARSASAAPIVFSTELSSACGQRGPAQLELTPCCCGAEALRALLAARRQRKSKSGMPHERLMPTTCVLKRPPRCVDVLVLATISFPTVFAFACAKVS